MLAQTQEIVPPHQPQHPLVVRHQALAPELRRDPPVAITAVRQRHPLDRVAHRGLFLPGRRGPPLAVVTRPAHPRQGAHPLDRELALRPWGRHRRDDRVDARTPGPSLGRRAPPPRRKACRKKSSSTCCWPTLRSSSAIRRRAVARSLPGSRSSTPKPLRGRHAGRSASTPPSRKCRHQRYKCTLGNCSSRARPATPSPARTRFTAESLNSRLKTRRLPLDIVLSSRTVPCFSVSFWGCTPIRLTCKSPVFAGEPPSPPTGKGRSPADSLQKQKRIGPRPASHGPGRV